MEPHYVGRTSCECCVACCRFAPRQLADPRSPLHGSAFPVSPSTVGKRDRERQKIERAQAKAERRAGRQSDSEGIPPDEPVRTEAELVEQLASLQHLLEAGSVSPEEFDDRRALLQAEFGLLF